MKRFILLLLLFGICRFLSAQDYQKVSEFNLGDSKQYGIAEIFRQSIISLKESNDHTCSFSPDGNIYFSRIKGRHAVILVSKFEKGHYLEAAELPSPINEKTSNNYHPFISPNGDYIIFNSERNGGYGGADLYISFKDLDGNWGEPINLGNKINSDLRDICPTITPDGKYLFFTRNWQKNNKWYGDIYWIETSFSEWKKGIIKSN
jgi:Tol biopolymer transport system component